MSGKKRILHVEDHRSQQELVRIALERLGGYGVRSAGDGFEAVQFARSFGADLFLLDLDLPGRDGIETLAKLREVQGMQDVPAIFLTAAVDPQTVARLRALGARDVLSKPLRPRALVAAVERVINAGGADSPPPACS